MSKALPSGATCNFTIEFAPKAAGSRTASVTVDGGTAGVVVVSLEGSGFLGGIVLTPTNHDFGTVIRGQGTPKTFMVTGRNITAGASVGPISVLAPQGFRSTNNNCEGVSLIDGQSCTFDVSISGGGPIGVSQAKLVVFATNVPSMEATISAITSAPAKDSSLIGFWNFNQNTNDSSPFANNATSVSGSGIDAASTTPSFAVSPLDYALRLSANRWARVPISPSLKRVSSNGAVSASMWLRAGGQANDGFAIAFSGLGSSWPEFGIGFSGATQKWFASVGLVTRATSTTATDGSWHHVAATFDGVLLKLFVDGKLESVAMGGGNIDYPIRPLTIGAAPADDDTVTSFFVGDIDDLRLYERNLSDAEIIADKSR